MKRTINILLMLAFAIQTFCVKVFATDTKAVNPSHSFKEIREKAIKEDKVFDISKYEESLKNAGTEEERQKVLEKYDKYAVYTEYVYFSKQGDKSEFNNQNILDYFEEGDTRISYSYLYGTETGYYDSETGSTLDGIVNDTLSIAISLNHPALGMFFSVLGYLIEEPEYETYTGVIARSLHDYVVVSKKAQVYDGSYWVTMVTALKKETSAQANIVYYEDAIRMEPSNMDLGLVKEETALYYDDESHLLSLAVNLYFSSSSPFVYYYYNGDEENYNNDYLFDY